MTTVFVTGAGGGIGQGIVKALRLIDDLDLRIVAADMSPLSPGLYAADLACIVPPASSRSYLDTLVRLFRDLGVDYYFPGTDVELTVCAEAGGRIQDEAGTRVVVAPHETVRIASDKYATFQFLRNHGFAAPRTYLPDSVDPGSLGYPVVVKPRSGARSQGYRLVAGPAELANTVGEQPDSIVQEYVGSADSEYTCTVVGVGGRQSDPFVLQRWLRDGDTYRAVPVLRESVREYVSQVAAKLDLEGPCNFQLRVDGAEPKLFEINARCSGTTPLWAQLGFNPVECYLKGALGLTYRPQVRYGVTVLRYWAEMIVADEDVRTLDDGGPTATQPLLRSGL